MMGIYSETDLYVGNRFAVKYAMGRYPHLLPLFKAMQKYQGSSEISDTLHAGHRSAPVSCAHRSLGTSPCFHGETVLGRGEQSCHILLWMHYFKILNGSKKSKVSFGTFLTAPSGRPFSALQVEEKSLT